jgi:hypothetical protein
VVRHSLLICTLKSDFEGATLDFLEFEQKKIGSDKSYFFQGGHLSFFLIYGMKPNLGKNQGCQNLIFLKGLKQTLVLQIKYQGADQMDDSLTTILHSAMLHRVLTKGNGFIKMETIEYGFDKKNLVFHFGGGRHASFPQKPVVKP